MSTCSQSPGLEWLWAESQVEVLVCVLPSPEERRVSVLLWTLPGKSSRVITPEQVLLCVLLRPHGSRLWFLFFCFLGFFWLHRSACGILFFGGFFDCAARLAGS